MEDSRFLSSQGIALTADAAQKNIPTEAAAPRRDDTSYLVGKALSSAGKELA